MLWVAALLASIIWVLGLGSGFLGFGIHVFLLVALLAGLAALLPPAHDPDPTPCPEAECSSASFVPGREGEVDCPIDSDATPSPIHFDPPASL